VTNSRRIIYGKWLTLKIRKIRSSDLEMGKYYFNNNFNGEIRSGPNPKIRKVGPSDLEYVFKEATWRV
jgi:hypothetical protein